MRVLIAVTHLLGAGHLTRAAALARAFAAAGHETVLVSGGVPAPLVRLDGVRLVQLPPVRSAGLDFGRLVGPEGESVGTPLLARRRRALLDVLHETAPDVVVTELFPFGRRALAAEFVALAEAARARPERPLILASVRDILVAPDRPAKVEEAHARLRTLYDALLVHGDPALVGLDASWPLSPQAAAMVRYTGYVDEGGGAPVARERSGVLVAAGSSAAGLGLFRAAAGAAGLRPDLGWRILVGHGVPEAELAALSAGLPDGTVMRARPDYRELLAGAALSISQCGYNTAVDLIATGTPAVLVPFEAGRETEQRLRAERLAVRGRARILSETALSPESLCAAVVESLGTIRPDEAGTIDLGGGACTVAMVEAMRQERRVAWSAQDSAFGRLRTVLDRVAEEGRRVPLWWRDDDATAATPALDRLLELARGANLLIAAIPAGVEPSLARRLAGEPGVSLAVHGLAHTNHAPPGEKAAEFGPHRPLADLKDEARQALRIARERLPADLLLPVFVPPWNRLSADLAEQLAACGYVGLSAAGGPPVAGLLRSEATLDPVDWHGTRSLRDPASLLRAIAEHAEKGSQVPLGLLTHHLVHDAAIWDFLGALIPLLRDHPAVELRDPRLMFRPEVDAAGAAPISGHAERARTG